VGTLVLLADLGYRTGTGVVVEIREGNGIMRAPRFSIRSLLGGIAITGVGLAMLRSPLPVWGNVAYTVAGVAVIAGASIAIIGRDAQRAYWVGFTLFGAGYLGFSDQLVTETMLDLIYPCLAPESIEPPPASPNILAAPAGVPVGSAVQYAYPTSPVSSAGSVPATPTLVSVSAPATPFSVSAPAISGWDYWLKPDRRLGELYYSEFSSFSPTSFRRIGHSLVALLAAALGGAFVRWRYEEHARKRQPTEVAS
jgi:hypothetical protein